MREALDLLALLYRDAAAISVGSGEPRRQPGPCSGDPELTSRRTQAADWAGAALMLGEARAELAYNVSPEAIVEVALSRIRRRILEPSPERGYPGS